MRVVNRPRVVAALPIRLLISAFKDFGTLRKTHVLGKFEFKSNTLLSTLRKTHMLSTIASKLILSSARTENTQVRQDLLQVSHSIR